MRIGRVPRSPLHAKCWIRESCQNRAAAVGHSRASVPDMPKPNSLPLWVTVFTHERSSTPAKPSGERLLRPVIWLIFLAFRV